MDCLIVIANYMGTVPNTDCTFSYREKVLSEGFQNYFDRSYDPAKICVSQTGKPYLPMENSVFFNLSNTFNRNISFPDTQEKLHTIVGAFFHQNIGIDIEYPRKLSESMLRKCFSESERFQIMQAKAPEKQAIRFWTLKESYVKFLGSGITTNMANYSFYQKDGQYYLESDQTLHFSTFEFDHGLLLSICTKDALTPSIQHL